MDNSFKFFRNAACAYFPCHQGLDPARFNCLFCYCPLYFLPECGGQAHFTSGVKDCSSCLRPHLPEEYEVIIARLRREIATHRSG